MEPFSAIRTQRTERDGPEHQERNRTEYGWNDWKKNERKRNNTAGDPRSIT